MIKQSLITCFIFSTLYLSAQESKVLSLSECIEIAVENNLSIQRSELNFASAEVARMQAKAQRYPTLNANGNFGYNWGRGIDPTTNQFIDQRINFNGVGLNTSLPLINGLQVQNAIRQSELDAEASENDLKRTANDISLSTAQIYLNVIFNKELLENAKFQLESGREQLNQTTILVESGALPIANKLQLESQVATNEVALINAENNLDLALLDLKQALLLPPGQEVDILIPDIDVDASSLISQSIVDLYQSALESQPEIESAELRVKSAGVGLDISRGAAYPSLSLNGSIGTNYSDAFQDVSVVSVTPTGTTSPTPFITANGVAIQEQEFDVELDSETVPLSTQYDNNLNTRLSLNLSIPIFNGFRTRSDIQRSKINLQQAEINETEQKNILYQTIESSYRNAVAAAKTYESSLKQVKSLEETYRAIENQYNNGAANFTDYQVANNNLFQARTDLARAKFDYIFRKKILEFYQGKPLQF